MKNLAGVASLGRNSAAGFYWIRFEGVPVVAEYLRRLHSCSARSARMHWHIPGSPYCTDSKEICELLSAKLERPT